MNQNSVEMLNKIESQNASDEINLQMEYIEKSKEVLKGLYPNGGQTYHILTTGCQMNALQSETVCGIMEQLGYTHIDSEKADVVIFNTCTVRENANQKIYGHLGHLKATKRKNPNMKIILFGCMMQEEHVVTTIQKQYKYVDLVFGTHNINRLPLLLKEAYFNKERVVNFP